MKTTSIEAYKDKIISGSISNDYVKIYAVLKGALKPFTYSEIAYCLGWKNPNKVSRRLKEMCEKDIIEECEIRVCTIANSRCTTYRIKG